MLQVVLALMAIGLGLFLWERFPAFKWVLAAIIAVPILFIALALYSDHADKEKRQQEQAEQAKQYDKEQGGIARNAQDVQSIAAPPKEFAWRAGEPPPPGVIWRENASAPDGYEMQSGMNHGCLVPECLWFVRAGKKDDPVPFLFELLPKPNYSQAWHALFVGEQHVDDWLAKYAETLDGPSSPGTTIKLSGISYETGNVCKAHDCGDNRFYVLFAPTGSKAWGLLLKDGNAERFFGDPDDEKKNALRAAANI
jgi:hypothetical protein